MGPCNVPEKLYDEERLYEHFVYLIYPWQPGNRVTNKLSLIPAMAAFLPL